MRGAGEILSAWTPGFVLALGQQPCARGRDQFLSNRVCLNHHTVLLIRFLSPGTWGQWGARGVSLTWLQIMDLGPEVEALGFLFH